MVCKCALLAHVGLLQYCTRPCQTSLVHIDPLFKPIQVLLDGIPTFCDYTTELKLAEGVLNKSSMSSIKMLIYIGPEKYPLGIPLITGFHLEIMPLVVTVLCVTFQPILYPPVHPSNLYLSKLEIWMCCGTLSKVVHKSGQMIPVTLPLSINAIIP